MTPAAFKARRVALGLTQEQLARDLEVSTATVSRWEAGRVGIPHPSLLSRLLTDLERRQQAKRRKELSA